ncbi:hypothetical protein [Sinomicrobium weinanense]|uniref:Uncharacterized protein n=1 Tax=Sinomicrobium weinanense TaxID=2842200 RepID=A0A926JQ64_9FLAO|nr:hypothetical protein [Sinomicrobium weinanense]MBC9795267.1 hypothetical protein [Sinomicrobium weinanense]MBU3125739.1 hypothetical protein [Sinomicrobium weinanense]
MKSVLIGLFGLLFFISCKAQKIINDISFQVQKDSVELKDIGFVTVENLYIKLKNGEKEKRANDLIFELSENFINNSEINKSIEGKKALLESCNDSEISNCNYIVEKYQILYEKNGLINIEYKFHPLFSPREYYKYACYDLNKVAKINAKDFLKEPITFLEVCNTKIEEKYKEYPSDSDGYEMVSEYLENKNKITIEDLDEIRIIRDDVGGRVSGITINFQPFGGVYSFLNMDNLLYFKIKELKPYLKEDFKKQLGLE